MNMLEKAAQELAATSNPWSLNFGYQPGKVIMVFAFRKDDGIIVGDCTVNVEDVDELIERIRLTKIEAERARQ